MALVVRTCGPPFCCLGGKRLTNARWDELAPLIEQCRPPHKTEHDNLRRTIEAIVWRHENGAKWRSLPPHLGPWWMAAQTFIRWSRHGVWERLLELAQQRDGIKLALRSLTAPRSDPTRKPLVR